MIIINEVSKELFERAARNRYNRVHKAFTSKDGGQVSARHANWYMNMNSSSLNPIAHYDNKGNFHHFDKDKDKNIGINARQQIADRKDYNGKLFKYGGRALKAGLALYGAKKIYDYVKHKDDDD